LRAEPEEDVVAVIAMTREMGSLGKDVAAGLAERLGLEVVHHELVEHDVAGRLGMQESAVHHFLEGSASMLERWQIDAQRLSRYTAEEILELAARGNAVIRGWGAVSLLRPVPHVLCVRVYAPMEIRVKRLMQRLGIADADLARREIERNDASHASTMQRFFAANWEDPALYDIVLNTERVPIESCIEQVRLLAGSPAFRESDESRAVLADKLLEARIRLALADRRGEARGADEIEVAAKSGSVVLSGAVDERDEIDQVAELVRSVAGVLSVENNLRHITGYERVVTGSKFRAAKLQG
jgi:cytidylate kinase